MPLNLNKDKLRSDLRGEQQSSQGVVRKPPTTSQRAERLKTLLAQYHKSSSNVDAAVMSIVMTSLQDEDIKRMLISGFQECDGASWRKIERIHSTLKNPELSVAAFYARLSYAEIESLLDKDEVTPEAIILMSKLQKRTEDSGLKQGSERTLPALSSSGLRDGRPKPMKKKRSRGRR